MRVNLDILNSVVRAAEANEEFASAKLAAAIVKKNRIISFGFNSKKTHPFQAKYARNDEAIYLHAEIAAIKNALRHISVDDLCYTTLYIARVKKTAPFSNKLVWGLAKPCAGCARAISEFGIKNVVYTTNEHKVFECI